MALHQLLLAQKLVRLLSSDIQRVIKKIATEITLVLEGQVKMFDQVWNEGDIISIEPNEATAFEALEDTITVVVKIPGALDDKYLV